MDEAIQDQEIMEYLASLNRETLQALCRTLAEIRALPEVLLP